MSQLFDSLRRDGSTHPRPGASRTARADAVLATLGYGRVRRRHPSVVAIAWTGLAVALLGALWAGWKLYERSEPARPLARKSTLNATARLPAASPLPSNQLPPNLEVSASSSPVPPATAASLNSGVRGRTAHHSPPLVAPLRTMVPSPPDRQLVTHQSSISPAPPGTASPARPTTADDLELALYYHRAGDFENALQHYRALLRKNELNAQAHNNLGLLYQEKNLLQESARELQRAILIEPRNPGARNNYGVTLLKEGKVDEAMAQFRAVLGLDPQNLDALVNLAIAQGTGGQLDLARETLLRALTIAPRNAAAHYNLGQLYDQTNEPARAIEHYRTFLDTAGAEHAARAAAVRARIALLSRTPE